MKSVVSYHAAKAGCITSVVTEETASSFLLDEFIAEQCSTMFYTKPQLEFAVRTHQLREVLKAATSLPQDQRGVKLCLAPGPHGIGQGRPRRASGRDHSAPPIAGNRLV